MQKKKKCMYNYHGDQPQDKNLTWKNEVGLFNGLYQESTLTWMVQAILVSSDLGS